LDDVLGSQADHLRLTQTSALGIFEGLAARRKPCQAGGEGRLVKNRIFETIADDKIARFADSTRGPLAVPGTIL
jgi:hypothetical protein